jgi:antitoxin MazE
MLLTRAATGQPGFVHCTRVVGGWPFCRIRNSSTFVGARISDSEISRSAEADRLSTCSQRPSQRLSAVVYCDYNVITMTTKTRVVRIGNSRGIRIPKTLLEEAELSDEVELHAEPGRLVVEAVRHARKGWAAAAQRMHARSEDRLLDEPTPTRFDSEEWEWR